MRAVRSHPANTQEKREKEREKEIETDGAATVLLRRHEGNREIG